MTREALTPVLANLPGTAADHCGMMGCLAVDLLGASCAATGNLEALFEFIRRAGAETADSILYPAVRDAAQCKEMAERMALAGEAEARRHAAKLGFDPGERAE